MTMTLQNLARRKQLFALDHPKFRLGRWGYHVASVRVHTHHPKTGNVTYRVVKKKHPGTLTLLGGRSITGLPDEIAAVPAIAAALRKQPPKIRLVPETADMKAAAQLAAEREAENAAAAKARAKAKAGQAAADAAADAKAREKVTAKARTKTGAGDAKKKADAEAKADAKAAADAAKSTDE